MALQEYEKVLLAKVISVAGDDPSMVREGVVEALKGTDDRGTRNYLWHTLTTAAMAKIRRARKNAEQTHQLAV